MEKIVILGSGNVAHHLATALLNSGFEISQIFGRNEISASKLANDINSKYVCQLNKLEQNADYYYFCMNDIANIEISKNINIKNQNAILIHTAGSQSINIFSGITKNFGAFYPFQTFTKGVKTDFSKVPICIEASNIETLENLKDIANKLQCKSYNIDEKGRETLHLCGVFAANFINHCVSISEELLKESKINPEIINPLLQQSFYKILTNGATKSQTGPALREDKPTIEKHLNLLKDKKQYSEVYKVLTESIIEWKKKN